MLAFEQDQSNVELKIKLADIYAKTEKIEEAEQLCIEAIELEPGSSEAHYTLGKVY